MTVKKLLEKGFYVFPLRKDSKVPYKDFHWRDLSSNALRKVLIWQRRYKNCNWAVDTGKSGLVVVDIDNKNGKNGSLELEKLEERYGKLTDTYTVETTTGGLHLYFAGKAQSSIDKMAMGLDVKSDGGYVVAEGSKLDGVEYEVIFETDIIKPQKWLMGLAGAPSGKKKTREDIGVEMDLTPNVMRAIDYLTRAEGAIKGKGGDAYTYQVACKVRDFGVSKDTAQLLMLDHWYEKCAPNSKEQFVIRKVENAYNYAQESQGVNTPEAMFDEVKETDSNEETIRETPKEKSDRIIDKWGLVDIIVPVTDFHDVQFPPKDHFLYPWVSSQTISMIYGDAGTGKTWLALAIAHAVTTGTDFGPWQFKRKAKTLYLDAEMTGVDVQYRLQHMNLLSAKNFFIYSDALGNLRSKPKANIMSKSWREAVKTVLLKLGIEYWIMDNLASLTPSGDENTKEDWNPINQWLLDLRFNGISTHILHHTNKSGFQRGTSARLDNIDFSLRLVKPKDYKPMDGARFDIIMEKGRIDHKDLSKMIDIQTQKTVDERGQCEWIFGKPKNAKKAQILYLMVNEKRNTREISEQLNISQSAVTQNLRKFKSMRYIDRDDELSLMGEQYLSDNEEFIKDLIKEKEDG